MTVAVQNTIDTPQTKLRSLNSPGGRNGRFGGEHVHDEQIQAETREHRLDDDLAGGEPVLLLAAIEHQLQRGHADRQHREAGPVEPQL